MNPVLAFSVAGFRMPLPVIVLGAIVGTTYGLLAAGIVLVYRTNRIINFAHGEIGAFGAALLGIAVLRWHIPYYLACFVAFAAAGGAAALAEVAVVRRLRHAPRVMSIVATLGVGQFLVFFSAAISPHSAAGFLYPSPPGLPTFDLGPLRLTQAYVGMLVGGPLMVVALVVFLRKSRFGLAMRFASANPEAARMSGVFASRMSSLAWAIAGILSTFTAMLLFPARGFGGGEISFGPSLLLRALTGAVVARMTSLPIALAAGVGLGIVEQLLLWNYPRAGFVEVALFAVILVALLVQRGVSGRGEEKGNWAATQGWRPLPERLVSLREVRLAPWVLGAAALLGAVVLPLVVSNASDVILTEIMAFAIVGLSVTIITGLGGQLSLGQFAIGSIGAVISFEVSSRVGAFPLALLYAGLAAAAASLVIGLPALRIRGLLLTVTTLGFALVTGSWLLDQPWALHNGVNPGRPIVFGTALETGRQYYFFALAVLLIALALTHNIRRNGFGRLMVAVRDNEDNARAFTLSARLIKIQGFLVAGFVAGVGGAVYGHLLPNLGSSGFPTGASIDVVAMTVIGGVSLLVGPIIGAFYIIGIPRFVPLDSAGLAATQFGWLILILYLPGGIAQGLEPVRGAYVRWAARRHGIDPEVEPTLQKESSQLPALPARPSAPARRGGPPLLEGIELHKHFGGIHAVAGVNVAVRSGEIVGLIGPNGAGKTTTFELLAGFTRQDAGTVRLAGEDVSDLTPERRGRLGLIRSFQDAGLFPTMTVLETARLAFERVAPTSFLRSALGWRSDERNKDRLARDLIATMGLAGYRHRQIQELSTGTRRITEIACLIALSPQILLLDEPSSGIAQRETEALGTLLRDIRRQLGITMLIIEHDIPLIMELADRVVAMDAGQVIAAGPPAAVRGDPAVVEAYLGGAITAIERSGTTAESNGALDVPGLGKARKEALLAAFGSVEAVRRASVNELVQVRGVGPSLAQRVLASLKEHQ